MNHKDFLDVELKLYNLLTTITPENSQRVGYILGDKFIVGLRKLIKQVGSDSRELLYVFVETEGIKIGNGSVVGIRVTKGLKMSGQSSFTIYYKANKGINAVVYLCSDEEDKEVELKRIRKVSYKRRPNGWSDLEHKRLNLKQGLESKGETTLTFRDIHDIKRVVGRLTYDMFNYEGYREFQFKYTTDLGQRGRTSLGRTNKIGFRVRTYDKDNNIIEGHYNSIATYEHTNHKEIIQYIETKLYEYLQGKEKIVRNVYDNNAKKIYLDRE